jgi:hypothetical protein
VFVDEAPHRPHRGRLYASSDARILSLARGGLSAYAPRVESAELRHVTMSPIATRMHRV